MGMETPLVWLLRKTTLTKNMEVTAQVPRLSHRLLSLLYPCGFVVTSPNKEVLMHTMPKSIVALLALMLLTASVSTAFADAKTEPFTLTCGGEEITVVTPSEHAANAQVVGSTTNTVATRVTISTTFQDPATQQSVTETETFTYGAGHGKARGLQNKLQTCSTTFSFQDPDVGLVTGQLSVTLFMTPHR